MLLFCTSTPSCKMHFFFPSFLIRTRLSLQTRPHVCRDLIPIVFSLSWCVSVAVSQQRREREIEMKKKTGTRTHLSAQRTDPSHFSPTPRGQEWETTHLWQCVLWGRGLPRYWWQQHLNSQCKMGTLWEKYFPPKKKTTNFWHLMWSCFKQ